MPLTVANPAHHIAPESVVNRILSFLLIVLFIPFISNPTQSAFAQARPLEMPRPTETPHPEGGETRDEVHPPHHPTPPSGEGSLAEELRRFCKEHLIRPMDCDRTLQPPH